MFFFSLRVGIGLQGGGNIGRLCRCFAQVAHTTAAAQVWCLLLFVGQGNAVAEAAVEMVGGKIEVAHLFFVAVAVGIAAFFGETVAVAQIAVAALVGEVERLDLGFFKGEQFAFLADAILVEIAPNAQLGKGTIGGIYFAVAIVIQFCQRLIAVGGAFAVFQRGIVAKQLAAIIDDTVAIAVINEEAVVLAYPASSGADTVIAMVKERPFMPIAGNRFDAVAVQIEGERIIDNNAIFTGKSIPIFMVAGKPVPALTNQGANAPANCKCTQQHHARKHDFARQHNTSSYCGISG